MAYLRMPLGNANFTALLSILSFTRITETVGSHAELTVHSLADMAPMRPFISDVGSSNPEWYHEGMRTFAYSKHYTWFWEKRHITWALMNKPEVMKKKYVIRAMKAGFRKWAKVSPFTFERVSPTEKPDIRVQFVPEDSIEDGLCVRLLVPKRNGQYKIDQQGVTIQFSTTKLWIDRKDPKWTNFRFVALYKIGHILGLYDSEVPGAVMFRSDQEVNKGFQSPYDVHLTADDIVGIQTIYGPPTMTENTTPKNGRKEPSPPGSSSSSTSSSISTSSSSTSTSSSSTDSSDSSSDKSSAKKSEQPGRQYNVNGTQWIFRRNYR